MGEGKALLNEIQSNKKSSLRIQAEYHCHSVGWWLARGLAVGESASAKKASMKNRSQSQGKAARKPQVRPSQIRAPRETSFVECSTDWAVQEVSW